MVVSGVPNRWVFRDLLIVLQKIQCLSDWNQSGCWRFVRDRGRVVGRVVAGGGGWFVEGCGLVVEGCGLAVEGQLWAGCRGLWAGVVVWL